MRMQRGRRHDGACYHRSVITSSAPCRATGSVSAEPQPDSRTPAREAGFLQIVFAVWSSFFGVRKRRDHDAIARSIKPHHLIVAGLVGALLFILTLVVVVRVIVANA